MFSNLKYDFRRCYEKCGYKGHLRKVFAVLGAQGFQAVWGYRMCRWLVLHHIPIVYLLIQRCVEIGTGISISPLSKIGKGFMINHFGCIVVNADAVIGENCTISHGVTIGNKNPGGKSPVIGDGVYICAGAKVLGDIVIGNNSIVGANAVLVKSIDENSVAAGIPAKVIRQINPNEIEVLKNED